MTHVCLHCGHRWESRAKQPRRCPECGSTSWDEAPRRRLRYDDPLDAMGDDTAELALLDAPAAGNGVAAPAAPPDPEIVTDKLRSQPKGRDKPPSAPEPESLALAVAKAQVERELAAERAAVAQLRAEAARELQRGRSMSEGNTRYLHSLNDERAQLLQGLAAEKRRYLIGATVAATVTAVAGFFIGRYGPQLWAAFQASL